MRRVLVTGGSGVIGAATIAPLLARGFNIHMVGRKPIGIPGVEYHPFDLLTACPAEMLRAVQPTDLLHLAWHDDRATLWHSPRNSAWVTATLNLLHHFRDTGGARAVLAGSCAEYDWTTGVLDEATTPLRPVTPYGKAKKELSETLTGGALAPLSIGWARICFPFGPTDKPDRLLSMVIDGVSAGREVNCSDGEQIRPFIHVDDVGAALAAFLDSEVENAVNIASDELRSVRDLALDAARLAGDASLVRFGTRPRQPWEPQALRATTRRLYEEVRFKPRFTLVEAVADTVTRRLAAKGERRAVDEHRGLPA